MNKKTKTILIASGVLTAVICLLMNVFLMPHIETNAQGLKCFDMTFGYNVTTATQFLKNIGREGREFYLHYQLALDFFYPLAYCTFFATLMTVLQKKKTFLLVLPVILAVLDYCENICIFNMLKTVTPAAELVNAASVFTMGKTILMYITILVEIILIIKRIIDKKRVKE